MPRLLFLCLILAAAANAQAAEEDNVHRADRFRTQQLNRNAAAMAARRDAGNGDKRADYARARARYERELAEWRAQIGNWDRPRRP